MFALYEEYGVPYNDGRVGLDLIKTEAAIQAAYDGDPAGMAPICRSEINFHQPLVERDHSSRVYVQILTRVMGEQDDIQAAHDERMRAALAALAAGKASG